MLTQPQIIANRLNAQKSTGPRTPRGKAIVSQNALKHGLSARQAVITTENQADFDLHRDALLAELDPEGPMESMLAERIVSLSWRLKRADLIQNQTIDAMNEDNKSNPLAKLAKSFGLKGLGVPKPEPTASHPDLTLGRIALKDFSNARVLDRLLMYERRIEHSLYKTILELQRLNLLRNLEPPIPHSQHNLAPGACVPARRDFTGGSPQKSSEDQASSATPFSRRRHLSRGDDDALTPNSTTSTKKSRHERKISTCQERIRYPASSIQNHALYYAKQTQSPKTKNQRNPCHCKELRTKTTPTPPKKTNPNKPTFSTTGPVYRL